MKAETYLLVFVIQLTQILGIVFLWIWSKTWAALWSTAEQRDDIPKQGITAAYLMHRFGRSTFAASLSIEAIAVCILSIVTSFMLVRFDFVWEIKIFPFLIGIISICMNWRLFRAASIADSQLRTAINLGY